MSLVDIVRTPLACLGWAIDATLQMRAMNRALACAEAFAPKPEQDLVEREAETEALDSVAADDWISDCPPGCNQKGWHLSADSKWIILHSTDSAASVTADRPAGVSADADYSAASSPPVGHPSPSPAIPPAGDDDPAAPPPPLGLPGHTRPPFVASGNPDPVCSANPVESGAGSGPLAQFIFEVITRHECGDPACIFYAEGWVEHISGVIAERIEKATPPAPFTHSDLARAATIIRNYADGFSFGSGQRVAQLELHDLAKRLADAGHADPTP